MLHKMKKIIPFCIRIFKDCFLLLIFLVYFNKSFTVPETVQKTFSKIIIIRRTDELCLYLTNGDRYILG